MTLAIVVLMTLLVYGLYQKSQDPDFKFFKISDKSTLPAAPSPAAPAASNGQATRAFGDIALPLPQGARIQSATLADERLVVIVTASDGDQVWVVDLGTGQVLGRVTGNPGGEGAK